MTAFGQQNQILVPTPAGFIDSDFPNGNDGSQNMFVWNSVAILANTLSTQKVGTALSIDISQFYTDPGSPNASFGFYVISGTDPRKAGFSFSGTNLTNSNMQVAAGSFKIVAIRGTKSVLSNTITYNITTPVAGVDNVAPTIPTGITPAQGTTANTISLTFDPPTDIAQANAPASGVARVDVLVNGVVSAPSPIVTPANSLASPGNINLGNVTTPSVPVISQNGSVWTMSAAGTGIDATASEQCLLADFGALTGFQRMVAQLGNYTSSAPMAMLGLMIHETNISGGKFISVGLRPSNGTVGLFVETRTTTGGVSSVVASQIKDFNGQNIVGPVYVKIERAADGKTLTVGYSLDQSAWRLITTQTIVMAAAVHYNLFATSQQAGTEVVGNISEVSLNNTAPVTTTINSSVPVNLQLRSVDSDNNVSSPSIIVLGQPKIVPVTNSIVWKPGHRIFPGSGTSGNRTTTDLVAAQAAMDKAVLWDINNQIKGFLFPFYMTQLEGPTAGDYTAGIAFVKALIAKAKSYNPPRDISFYINLMGNGSIGTTSTSFPSWFVPAYLNSSFYGGGCEWGGNPANYGNPSNPAYTKFLMNGTFWNINFMGRVSALVQAYYNALGPDTTTGGIYLIDLFSEVSLGIYSAATNAEFAATLNSVLPSLRAAVPKMMMTIRLTYGMKGTQTDLVNVANAMYNNKIAMGNEDHTNMILVPSATLASSLQNPNFSWGDKIYKGVYPGTSVDHSVLGDWAHVANVENAEYGQTWTDPTPGSPQGYQQPVPPAAKGSGYIYDNPNYPGIMSGTNFIKSSHIYWHVDQGQFGPNVNNTTYYSTAPKNPTPGPGAGSNAARPHLGDVLTGNTAYAGVTGIIPIPATAYPTSFP